MAFGGTVAGVKLKRITKSFGPVEVIKGISLDVADGEFLTLVGPSGCGKTTLLRIIAGLEREDDGEVLIGDQAVMALAPKQRDVAMVFQTYALYPHMTVLGNLRVPLEMRRLNFFQRLPLLGRILPGTKAVREQIRLDAEEVARSLEIAHLLSRKPIQLSGGQRQRVAVGRALVRHPQVFLMDEPLSNLDANLRTQMRAEIAQLHRRLGVTFIYVTHDQAEAMTMSDRVALVMAGKILQVAPPGEIYAVPHHIDVAEFIGSPKINVLPGRVMNGIAVETLGFRLELATALAPDTEVRLGVRPEGMRVIGEGESRGWSGQVRHVENLGSEVLRYVDVEGASRQVIAKLDPERDTIPSLRQWVHLQPRPGRVMVFGEDGARVHVTGPADDSRGIADSISGRRLQQASSDA